MLSAIVEVKAPVERLPTILTEIRQVASQVETVFSLDVITRVDDDRQIPVLPAIERAGFHVRPNAKINVGLGRPLIP